MLNIYQNYKMLLCKGVTLKYNAHSTKIRCMLEKRTSDLQFVDIAAFARLMGTPSK